MPKYPRYQDYVIKNGRFVGEFEEMYRDFDDPWEQNTRESKLSYKAVVLFLLQKYKFNRVMEIGCGFGHFTNEINKLKIDTLGIDISETAIRKAAAQYPECNFLCGDVLDFEIYEKFKPDCILFSEVTWYILDKLQDFIKYYKEIKYGEEVYLMHLLAMYAKGVQQYGTDYFSDLQGVLDYFDLDYEEYGQITYKELDGNSRTYFLGKPKAMRG